MYPGSVCDVWEQFLSCLSELVGNRGEEDCGGANVGVIPPEEKRRAELGLMTTAELGGDGGLAHSRGTDKEADGLVSRHPLIKALPHCGTRTSEKGRFVGVALSPVTGVVRMRDGVDNLLLT